MKKILVPTDFSRTAHNAINYAAEFALAIQAKLMLFHVYHKPAVPAEAIISVSEHEIGQERKKKLRIIQKNLQTKYGNKMMVEYASIHGVPIKGIVTFAEENKVDFIIMGMEGVGYFTERLVGSISTAVIKKSICPVLIINKHTRFRKISRIVLACNYSAIKNTSVFEPIIDLVLSFQAQIHVLNIVPEEQELLYSVNKTVESFKVSHLLKDVEHSFDFTKNDDVIDGINDFAEEHKMDMIVMVAQKHTLFQNLLHESNTKRMAFHARVPLLILHE